MTTLELTTLRSPLGDVTAAWQGDRLCAFGFTEHWPRLRRSLTRRFGEFDAAPGAAAPLQARLDAYFAGDLQALDGVAVDPGGTDFQAAVWSALRTIRPGATKSYGELARQVGAPSAVRAVGAANGANPIWLIIPCHRAIGADGSLTGYAGGLERKRWLLEHEGALQGALVASRRSGDLEVAMAEPSSAVVRVGGAAHRHGDLKVAATGRRPG